MKVKCYDMETLLKSHTEDKFTAFGPFTQLVVLQGPQGYVTVCREGVHWITQSVEETLEVEAEPNDADEHPNSFRVMATHKFDVPVKDILGDAPSEDVDLGNFVRRFGWRLENNYQILLRAIKEIGLDPADYPRDVA